MNLLGDGVEGIYNGEDFVYTSSSSWLWSMFSMLGRYGLDVFRLWSFVNEMFSSFDRLVPVVLSESRSLNVCVFLESMISKTRDVPS